jgi:hypothetical protein
MLLSSPTSFAKMAQKRKNDEILENSPSKLGNPCKEMYSNTFSLTSWTNNTCEA